jgi:HEAT repeat protein
MSSKSAASGKSGKSSGKSKKPWDDESSKANGARAKNGEVDVVLERLREIDPNFTAPRENQFSGQIVRGRTATDELIAHLKSKEDGTRSDAAEALGIIGDTRALRPLREMLSDPNAEVRMAAAIALIKVGDEALFPEIVKGLRAGDPNVVVGAALALGRLADRRVVPNLVEAFKTTDPRVGASVAWALGQCGDPACLPWLTTALDQGFAAPACCEALGRIGDPKALNHLVRALESKEEDVRAYAARALGMMKAPQAGGALGARAGAMTESKAVPALKKCLKDSAKKVRLCASIALYELGDKAGGRQLVRELAE